MPRVETSEAAVPTTMAAEKARLFIIIMRLQSSVDDASAIAEAPQQYHATRP
jgi:hypothetical protein